MLRTPSFLHESPPNYFKTWPHLQTDLPCTHPDPWPPSWLWLSPPGNTAAPPPARPTPRPLSVSPASFRIGSPHRLRYQAELRQRKLSAAHLEHETAHAEDHAEEVHVVRRRVVQGRVTLARRGLVPATGSRVRGTQSPAPRNGQALPWASPHNPSPVPVTLGSSPQHFVRPSWVRHIVSGHGGSEVVPLPLRELQLPARKRRVAFRVAPTGFELPFPAAGAGTPPSQGTEN